jgi:Type I phosphodiesterase / nucleotide pyrophosphatase
MTSKQKILLLEFNEINWHVIDRLIADHGTGFLPNFVRLREQGAWTTQAAVERPPLLDPWITWVTLHTGVSPGVHGASVLEQDSETISAKRTWQYVIDAGRSVGVFGSISAYPPTPVNGFMVPGPFAPSDDTFPASLRPLQVINRRYTQAHNKTTASPGLLEGLRIGASLVRLGLRPSTCWRIVAQLVRERLSPHSRWRRVSLQPLLNFDFFAKLYERDRPDFATWHSNHAAHYMHHYWRAWDDSKFQTKSPPGEREKYGQAVPFGYQICDELLGRAMKLVDDETVLVLASSMGQQPYISEKYDQGKIVVRIGDIDKLLGIIGREGISEVVPTMVPQWNLTVSDALRRETIKSQFEGVRRILGDQEEEPGFSVSETGHILTITPLGLARHSPDIEYTFPGAQGKPASRHSMAELFATDAPTVKQGMHHINGVLAFFGKSIPRGKNLPPCTNLDVAPTLLAMMGMAKPAVMEGRVLHEAMT